MFFTVTILYLKPLTFCSTNVLQYLLKLMRKIYTWYPKKCPNFWDSSYLHARMTWHWSHSVFIKSLLVDLDALVEQSMFQIVDDFGVKLWKCKICGKANKDKSNIRRHMEKHFDGFEQKCSECDFVGKTREGLRRHKYRYHKS